MSRGEIWWSDLPGLGRRPVLILTRDPAIGVLDSVVVAILTRTIRGIPSEVVLEPSDGVPQRCAVSLDNIVTASKRRLIRRVTQLSSPVLADVCAALRYAVAC